MKMYWNIDRLSTFNYRRVFNLLGSYIFGFVLPASFFQWTWVMAQFLTILCFALLVVDAKSPWYFYMAIFSFFTYAIVTYRHIQYLVLQTFARQESLIAASSKPFSTIVRSENTHFLIMTILVNISQKNLCKTISLGIYSFISLSTFFIVELYPENGLAIALFPLYNYFEPTFLAAACTCDLLVTFVYLKECLLKQTSPLIFITYCLVFALRVENSVTCQFSLYILFSLTANTLQPHPKMAKLAEYLNIIAEMVKVEPSEEQFKDDTVCDETSSQKSSGTFVENHVDIKPRRRITSSVMEAFSIINDF